jgi:hypothetical protein
MTSEPAGSDEIVNWIIHVTCPSQGPRPAQPIAILFFPQHYAIIQKTPAKACWTFADDTETWVCWTYRSVPGRITWHFVIPFWRCNILSVKKQWFVFMFLRSCTELKYSKTYWNSVYITIL